MQTEKLTLRGWSLNAARILDKLIDKVIEAGGFVVEAWPFVTGPDLFEVKDENKTDAPVLKLRARSYLSFVINDRYMYVQLGSNPFMDVYYVKETTDGTSISRNPYSAELPWCWYPAEDAYAYLDDKHIDQAAARLFKQLCKADVSCTPQQDRRQIRRKEVNHA